MRTIEQVIEIPYKRNDAAVASPDDAPETDRRRLRVVRIVMWAVAILLGALQAWSSRHAMNSDGVSYLDMGDAYFRGDWAMAINTYWSPLYSWLLGFAMVVLRPSAYWEFAVAHLVNFGTYLGALFAFDYLLRELTAHLRAGPRRFSEERRLHLPAWAIVVLGYTLFIWTSLQFITLRLVTPDMTVSAFVYVAAAMLLRIRRGAASRKTYVVLGIVLGLGFLAKSIMFPLGFVFLAVSFVAGAEWRKAAPRALLAASVFLLISGPFILAFSLKKGRPTFGDSGKIVYAWFVDGMPSRHYQGDDKVRLKHPTRKIFEGPAIYEFGSPVGGTYPAWYDPSYWYEGVPLRFSVKKQVKAVLSAAETYHNMFFSYLQSSLFVGLLILLVYGSRDWRAGLADVAREYPLLVPAVTALILYALVVALPRYVAPFVVLLWLGLFAAVRLPDAKQSRKLVTSAVAVMAAMLVILIGVQTAPVAAAVARELVSGRNGGGGAHQQWQVMTGLRQQMGLQPGDKVAGLGVEDGGAGFGKLTSWARLARVTIVAEILAKDAGEFWAADAAVRAQAMEALARTGAKLIVTEKVPDGAAAEGWRKIGDTSYHAHFLPR